MFSPDGMTLAVYIASTQAVSGILGVDMGRIPVTGGAVRSLARVAASDDRFGGSQWGQDDTILYAVRGAIWRIPANGGTPEMIGEPGPDEVLSDPDLLPGNDWFLFSRVDQSSAINWDAAEILAQSLTTGERRMLYSGGSSARYVPTGHLVVAIGNTLYAVPFDLDSMAVTGGPIPVVSGVMRGANTGIAQYDISAAGTLVYVPGEAIQGSGVTLAAVDRNLNVAALPVPGGAYADPRVSPDSRWAAYTQTFADGTDISVYSLRGDAAPRRLTFGGTSRYPLWSRDNTRVAFQSTRDGTASLYWQLADGSGGEPARLTTAAAGESHEPDSFSPDGRWLTYTAATDAGLSIWRLELATGETEPLITEPGASQSTFSPDGRWLAYQSAAAGPVEVYVQPFPPTGARFQLPLAATNHHPFWSADGSRLYYFPGQARFESVPVTTEPGFSFGAVDVLRTDPGNSAPAGRRQIDTIPDGSGFLTVAAPGLAATGGEIEIRIVENWFEELKQLVPVP